MKKYYLLFPVLFLFIPVSFSHDWVRKSVKFEKWIISGGAWEENGNLVVIGGLQERPGGVEFAGGKFVRRIGSGTKYKAGIKKIKVYLKDTLLTLSYDTVRFTSLGCEKKISLKSRGDKKVKIELESLFKTGNVVADTAFTLWSKRRIKLGFVYELIYSYVMAWLFVWTDPHLRW